MENKEELRIILDIFSGRENPTMMMTDAVTEVVLDKIKDLTETKAIQPPGLGYRGFRIHNRAGMSNIPGMIVVYNSTINITDDQVTRSYRDDKGLEEWFMGQEAFAEFEQIIREELKRAQQSGKEGQE